MKEEYIKFVKNKGKEAARRGLPVTANPYLDHTKDAALWREGYEEKAKKTGVK